MVFAILGKVAAVIGPLPGGHVACEIVKSVQQGKINAEFEIGGGKVKVEGTNIILLPRDVWIDCYDSETAPELDMEWSHPFP